MLIIATMSKSHKQKTNAARLLDQARVAYELVSYEVDESDLSAGHVAESLGEDVRQVFKTIVLHGDRSGYFVCVVPGDHEINLKKAAKASGNKKCELLPLKELLPTTGYIRGGCSPIGVKKMFPTYVHETAARFDYVYVSAGMRGLQLRIAPADLLRESKAFEGSLSGCFPFFHVVPGVVWLAATDVSACRVMKVCWMVRFFCRFVRFVRLFRCCERW